MIIWLLYKMDYTNLLSGSPLIPPDIMTALFAGIALLLFSGCCGGYCKKAGIRLPDRFKFLFKVCFLEILFILVGGALLSIYWLLPLPRVVRTEPAANAESFSVNKKIEIFFDRPVSRSLMEKSISPEVPGIWVFENSTYRTHLMRRVVFYPLISLPPNTEFTISLSKVRNVIKSSPAYDYTFKFKTQESPRVGRVEPTNGAKGVDVGTKIDIFLTAPNGAIAQLDFALEPATPFELTEDVTKTHFTLKPKEKLKQGTRYQLKIDKTDLKRNLASGEVVETGMEERVYAGYFTTKDAPGIDSIFPTGDSVSSREPVTIRFSKPMIEKELQKNFSISPAVEGSSLLIDHQIFVFTPKKYAPETIYTVKIAAGTKSEDGSFLPEEVIAGFTSVGKVKIVGSDPKDGAVGIGIKNPIKINFNQEVDQASAESKFLISPPVTGKFSWAGKTMVFTPDKPLPQDARYTIVLAEGIKSIDGLDSKDAVSISFTTTPSTFKLAVPIYLQQHPLSCEIADLRMVLAFRGIDETEEKLLTLVGTDPTPHQGNVWGNPYEAFVGNVNGKQMTTGYGVYWGPIARVARGYRIANDFTGWSITQVLKEVENGNPVIIWTYSKNGTPTSWLTPGGEKIFAVAGEHSVVVVGFVGPAENHSQVIVNDSLIGQAYWSREKFESRLAVFNGSGVVVY